MLAGFQQIKAVPTNCFLIGANHLYRPQICLSLCIDFFLSSFLKAYMVSINNTRAYNTPSALKYMYMHNLKIFDAFLQYFV